MSRNTEVPKRRAPGRWAAVAVLLLSLAATVFGVWRERELARRGRIIRFQDTLPELSSALQPLLGQRFGTLFDQARAALRQADFSPAGWESFLKAAEWRERFPGMIEIGYAEIDGDRCLVKYIDSQQSPPPYASGIDLSSDSAIRDAVQKSADGGYGFATPSLSLKNGSAVEPAIVGFLPIPIKNQRPASAAENRANLRGLVFFALNQAKFFDFCRPRLAAIPFNVRLLAPGEEAPPRTESQRVITMNGGTGAWRFFVSIKPDPTSANVSQWVVLGGGTAVSFLLFFLFATQSKLRHEAELSNVKILARESEITAMNRDLEQKIAERTTELNHALAEEKDLNRLKSNFISMVTHEIRTPLGIILGSSEILSRYQDRLPPEKRLEHLGTIDSAVQRMSALVEDVLLFSKAEAGRMEFNPAPMDLKKFCAQLVDEIESATHRRCPIELSMSGVTEPARGDENLLRHIFANLLSNASKYSPEKAPVTFSVSRRNGDAVFEVRDRGRGIPEADRKKLFTPFHRGRNVAAMQGTGLGLVIVKHCIERHGGKIEIESAENFGTAVSVELPLFSPAHTDFLNRLNTHS